MTIIIIIINPQCNPDLNRDDDNDHHHHQHNCDDHPTPPPPPLSAPLCSPASKRVSGEQPGKKVFFKIEQRFRHLFNFWNIHCTFFGLKRFSRKRNHASDEGLKMIMDMCHMMN